MEFQWDIKKYKDIRAKYFILSILLMLILFFIFNTFILIENPFLIGVVIIIILLLSYNRYLLAYAAENENSKIIIDGNILNYIQPGTGYEINIKKTDIEKVEVKKFIFYKLVLHIKGQQQLTLSNFYNQSDLMKEINAL